MQQSISFTRDLSYFNVRRIRVWLSLRGIIEMLIIKKHLLGTELNGVTVSNLQEEFHRPSHCDGNGLGIFMINFCT